MPKTPRNRYASIPLSGAFAYVVKVLFNIQTYRGMVAIGAIPIVCVTTDLTQV